jgi:hypothetical protein
MMGNTEMSVSRSFKQDDLEDNSQATLGSAWLGVLPLRVGRGLVALEGMCFHHPHYYEYISSYAYPGS